MSTIKQGTDKATSKMDRRGVAKMKRKWLTPRHVCCEYDTFLLCLIFVFRSFCFFSLFLDIDESV